MNDINEGGEWGRGTERLQKAWDAVKDKDDAQIENIISGNDLLDEKYDMTGTLRSQVTQILNELSQISDFEDFKEKCDVTQASPKYLMCLFFCGLIESDTMTMTT